MKTIWKFPLKYARAQKVMMPVGAVIIAVQPQNGITCLWAVCDMNAEKEERIFAIYETGIKVEKIEGEYIGTCQCALDDVQHVFELKPGDRLCVLAV